MKADAYGPSALEGEDWRALVDLAGAIIVVLNADETVALLNRSGCAVLGCRPDQAEGENWFDRFLPDEGREETRDVFKRILAGEVDQLRTHENEILRLDGRRRLIKWQNSVLRDSEGTIRATISSGTDVTDARVVQDALRRSYARLEDIERALDESTIVAATDQKGLITYANERFCKISGFSEEELLGNDHRIVNSGHHSKSFMRELWRTIANGEVWRGEIKNRAKAGHYYWVYTTIVPLLNERGKPHQYLAIRSDITAQKEAQAALEKANERLVEEQARLIRAEKLSSIGQLAAGVAHEINNPLAGAMACLRAIRGGRIDDARRKEYFQAIGDGLERIQATVGSLLSYARQTTPTVAAVSARELIESSVRLLRVVLDKKHVEAVVTIDDDLPPVAGDPSLLMQAIVNIVMNAAYAAPGGSNLELSAHRNHECVRLAVRDYGDGIPEKILNRICDPFFSTKPEGEGTGLGLAVTASIVQAHRGQLDFDTEEGAGTTVTMLLPVYEGE